MPNSQVLIDYFAKKQSPLGRDFLVFPPADSLASGLATVQVIL